MKQNKVLCERLLADLDEILRRFIKIFNIKFSEDISNLSNPLFRWLDFRMRYIDPIPRKVVCSQEFYKSLKSFFSIPIVMEGWRILVKKFKQGKI